MTANSVEFMKDLEDRYKRAAGLKDRSQFKIFYGRIREAPVLTLGINPGGKPLETSADGTHQSDGKKASASASFFENDENDILDCEWKENTGLRKLLLPYFEGDVSKIRSDVVKTNLAFRRSASKKDIDISAAILEAAPFLAEILGFVKPRVIILTGVSLAQFTSQYAASSQVLFPSEIEPKVKQVVFSAARAKLKSNNDEVTVVQVAHASQFNWTYERYGIPGRIRLLTEA